MKKFSLNGRWHFKQANEEHAIWLPATVPGCVHTDLLANNQIPDPYHRDNEHQILWVGETDWLYNRTFTIPPELLRHHHILLRCQGLDTLATIWLSGVELGRTNLSDNFFHLYPRQPKTITLTAETKINQSTISIHSLHDTYQPCP